MIIGGEAPTYVGNKRITGGLTIGGALTVGGILTVPNGANGAPSITFVGDTGAGFYQTGSQVIVTRGNVPAMMWTSNPLVEMRSDAMLAWSPTTTITASPDLVLRRAAEGSLTIGGTLGGNGQLFGIKMLTELTTIGAGANTDTTILLPANAIILAVSARVTVAIPVAATFTVGDAGSAARFSTAAIAVAANSTDPGTKAAAYYNATATAVRITPDLPPLANSGRVRVTIHYLDVTPPTA